MRKVTALLCLLGILFTMVPAALAAPGDAIIFSDEQTVELEVQLYTKPTMALIGDTLYTMWGSKFFSWKSGQAKPELAAPVPDVNYYVSYQEAQADAANPDRCIAYLVSDGTTLYGLNRFNGMLYPITFDAGNAVYGAPIQLDWSDMAYQDNSRTLEKDFYHLYIVGNKLYGIIWAYYKDYVPEFVSFDMSTGARQVYDVPFVQDITPYRDGKFLLKISDMDSAFKEQRLDSVTHTLAVYDPADGSYTEAGSIADASVYGMVYQPETDTLFYSTDNKLMGMKSFGAAAQVAAIPDHFPDSSSPALMMPDGAYAIATWSGLILRGTGAQYVSGGSLSVGGDMDSAAMAFMQKHPEVSVNFVDKTFYQSEQALAQAMVSGDSSLDIYSIDLSFQDFQNMMQKGYCMDLSTSPAIANELAGLYPFLQSAVQWDGRFYAVPVSVESSGLCIVSRTWEDNGLTGRIPQNFLDMIGFLNWWAVEGHSQYPNIQLMDYGSDFRRTMIGIALDLYVHRSQARNEELSFDTPLFRTIMGAVEGLRRDELNRLILTDIDEAANTPSLFTMGSNWLTVGGTRNISQNTRPLMLPLMEGETVPIPVTVKALFINPNTKNPDMALRYLENALEQLEPVQHILMFPNDNEPVPQENYEQMVQQWTDELGDLKTRLEAARPEDKKDLEYVIQDYERNLAQKDLFYWRVSAEDISQYRQQAAQCYTAMPNLLSYLSAQSDSELSSLVDRYCQKQLPLDQFIAQAEEKLRMIRLEKQ